MSGINFIPRNPVQFCLWLAKLLAYAKESCTRWGIVAPPEAMFARLEELEALAEKCSDKDHSPVDTFKRNEVRTALEREVRVYLRGLVSYNPAVTDEDRKVMGLPLRDKVRTPIGDPEGQAEADITYPGRTQLMLHIRHVEGTPYDKRANYGYRIYYGVYPTGGPLPDTGKDLRESRFTRMKKERFAFEQGDSGKTACFCIRYENNRGKAGLWGPLFSAVIP